MGGRERTAAIGLVNAGEQADQRRLAGAVLAEQHVDLTGMEIEGDIVVGDNAGERLGDAAQGDGGRGSAFESHRFGHAFTAVKGVLKVKCFASPSPER
jgi:hypothetical protein